MACEFHAPGTDYDIKCKLKIAHHVRYMDNYTLADDNKKEAAPGTALHSAGAWKDETTHEE